MRLLHFYEHKSFALYCSGRTVGTAAGRHTRAFGKQASHKVAVHFMLER